MSDTLSTSVEIRLSALNYAERLAQFRSSDDPSTTAERLIEDAKIIEAYITSETE